MPEPWSFANTGTITNVIAGLGALSLKVPSTAGSFVAVGYSEFGVDLVQSITYTTARCHWTPFPIPGGELDELSVTIACMMSEATITNLKSVLAGVSASTSSSITVNDQTRATVYVGAKIVGPAPNSGTRTITMPYGRALGPVNYPFRKNQAARLAFLFECMYDGTNAPYTIVDT